MATKNDFEPTLDIPVDQRVVISGDRIAVRIARWSDCHSGFEGCVRSPRRVNVDAAHVGSAELEDGSRLAVAMLPMGTAHADASLNVFHAAAHYENTGRGVARVRYSTDEMGIRADGLLFPDISPGQRERLLAAAPSGDWRVASLVRKPADFENAEADFAGACIVNIPGFSPTYSELPMKPMRLVASASDFEMYMEEGEGSVVSEFPGDCDGSCSECHCGRKVNEGILDASEPVLTVSDSGVVVEAVITAGAGDTHDAPEHVCKECGREYPAEEEGDSMTAALIQPQAERPKDAASAGALEQRVVELEMRLAEVVGLLQELVYASE